MRRLATTAVAALVLTAFGGVALAQTTITIESWRTDDSDIWNNQIIPAFEAAHQDIKVVYNPTAPTEYNAALNSRLEGGTAGDIIVCRPFDASLDIYNKGHLTSLNDLPGMSGFSDVAKSA
ncbi:MAG: ABC transporter substrate-binding protein, partial [Dongiaceae bacterium]